MSSHDAYKDDFTDNVIIWLSRWWMMLAAFAAVGIIIALILHATSQPQYTARIDFSIPESALGSPTFVQSVSRTYLERELGERADVSITPSGTISVVIGNLSADGAPTGLAALQDAVSGLRNTLNEQVSERFQMAQQDLSDRPDNASAYALVNHYRTYIDAHEAGLFEQIRVQNEGVAQTSLPMFNRVIIGLLVGLLFGACLAMALSVMRRR